MHKAWNYENTLQKLVRRMQLTPEEVQAWKGEVTEGQGETEAKEEKMEVMRVEKRHEYLFRRKAICMAQTEDEECLVTVFSEENGEESYMTLWLIRMDDGRSLERSMQTLKAKVTKMKFFRGGQLTLLVGSACGRLFVYRGFEQASLTVSCLRVAVSPIIDIHILQGRGRAVVLCLDGTVHCCWVGGAAGSEAVDLIFRCSIPLLQDPNCRLLVDPTQNLVCQLFSFGRLIVWQIPQQITGSSKRVILKPKMSALGVTGNSVAWATFFGLFLMVISEAGRLQIAALNLNENNELKQFYTIISWRQLCKGGQSFADAILKDDESLIVGKNVGGRCNYCVIEKYVLDRNYKVKKIVAVRPGLPSLLRELSVSIDGQIAMLRGNNHFLLLRTPLLF